MASKFPFDVAVASALGAIVSLSIALTLGWSPYLWPLVGLIVGPLCYRPWEILGTAFTLGRDLWKGAQNGIPIPRPNYRTIGVCLWTTARVFTCVLLTGISLFAIPTAIALILNLPMVHAPSGVWSMVTIMILSTSLGFMALLISFAAVPTIPVRWAMPITRQWLVPLFGTRGYEEHNPSSSPTCTWKDTYQICGLLAPISQLSLCLIIPLVLDLLITIALACASNKRIASMMGSTLGCTSAAIMATIAGVILPSLLVITLGTVVGWLMGPMLYLLREYLANHPSTVLVSPTS